MTTRAHTYASAYLFLAVASLYLSFLIISFAERALGSQPHTSMKDITYRNIRMETIQGVLKATWRTGLTIDAIRPNGAERCDVSSV